LVGKLIVNGAMDFALHNKELERVTQSIVLAGVSSVYDSREPDWLSVIVHVVFTN